MCDEKDFLHALIDFPVAGKAFGQNKAVARTKAVNGAVGVHYAAAAFDDVAKLDIARAVGAKSPSGGLPYPAGKLAAHGAEAFQRFVSGAAADRAAGFAGFGLRQVLGFDTNEGGL